MRDGGCWSCGRDELSADELAGILERVTDELHDEEQRRSVVSADRMRFEAKQRERLRIMRRHYRQTGYDDGFAGRPAASTNAEYQASWRRGREARETDGAA